MLRTKLRLSILAFTSLLATFGLNTVTAGPAVAIPGLGNVTAATVVDSSTFKAVVATCPVGQRVIGGGARLTLATGEVSITYLAPTAATTGYEARAYEDLDGFAGVWGLVVTAICANTPPGYAIVTAASPIGSPVTASVTATCPAGLQVLGTGGAVLPGRGVSVLTAIMPNAQVAPTAVTTAGAEIPGFPGTWNVQSWAICAAPVAGHTVVITTSVANSVSPKTQTSTCPPGRPVHGIGFQTAGSGVGEIFVNAAFPNPAVPVGTSVPVTASEDQGGVVGFWAIRTFAICAP